MAHTFLCSRKDISLQNNYLCAFVACGSPIAKFASSTYYFNSAKIFIARTKYSLRHPPHLHFFLCRFAILRFFSLNSPCLAEKVRLEKLWKNDTVVIWVLINWISTNRIPNFLKLRFQMVQYSNGQFMGYILCTIPTIWIPDQYIREQDGIHLSGIQMAFKHQTIWHSTTFRPFH